MSDYEVPEPILNSPFAAPAEHWYIAEGQPPERRAGRRPSIVFPPREQRRPWDVSDGMLRPCKEYPAALEMVLVNRIRESLQRWRQADYKGASNTSHELLAWWSREGRQQPLFFAQREAAETIIFLNEARADFLQGLQVPREELSAEQQQAGLRVFTRYACKMATGAGKTTVMGMIAAWSILNKVHDRSNAKFSDTVLIVCPNVTIRSRLAELDPQHGEASLYWTRDLVPPSLREALTHGRVLVTNWHVFEPRAMQVGGQSARVNKAGVAVRTVETITIGPKTTTARGSRYLTLEDFERQRAAGLLAVLEEERDRQGVLKKVRVESVRYVESDTALVNRVLGRDIGGKKNILVMNDEAHHAYRIRRETSDEEQEELFEEEDAEDFFQEATVWVEGLDRIHKLRGINFCLDLSATPYYLGRVGQDTGKPFPWVVSDFGLIDAIESGMTKIPQLAVRDTTGATIPGYFNIWQWILPQLTSAERGGKRANPKPEAILKYAHHPIAMLAALWQEELERRQQDTTDPRPPVFILVAKNTAIAKVLYEWLAEDRPPTGISPIKLPGFRNTDGIRYTIRVDSKVVHETDDPAIAKEDESRWMRATLDTVGKIDWPRDRQGRAIYPEGFEELARKLDRPLYPPGRDVRCIVSVGMLTEGWDCNTVTHIVGLRPFMSQLLCEQVVGRGLRRTTYDVGDDGRLSEEVAKVFGVPFEVIPFKADPQGAPPPNVKRNHVQAFAARAKLEIVFPRVERYTQALRNRVRVKWNQVATLVIDPARIPPEVEVKSLHQTNEGRMSLTGPGRIDDVSLREYRQKRRRQELEFELATSLTREYLGQRNANVPAQALFPQLLQIVEHYVREKVRADAPADVKDLFLSPYFGWAIERLLEAIQPDTEQGESPEIPKYESNRDPGSTADVDFWTSRDVREVLKSHVNYVVADTDRWEQSAAYAIDRHPITAAFVKNAGLGFYIPYLHNGQKHDYTPDFIVKLNAEMPTFLILEVKGWDPLEEVKSAAAMRWCAAVNADGAFGHWHYRIAKRTSDVQTILDEVAQPALASDAN